MQMGSKCLCATSYLIPDWNFSESVHFCSMHMLLEAWASAEPVIELKMRSQVHASMLNISALVQIGSKCLCAAVCLNALIKMGRKWADFTDFTYILTLFTILAFWWRHGRIPPKACLLSLLRGAGPGAPGASGMARYTEHTNIRC